MPRAFSNNETMRVKEIDRRAQRSFEDVFSMQGHEALPGKNRKPDRRNVNQFETSKTLQQKRREKRTGQTDFSNF
eukprot:6382393-Amphidinium_carterae.1